MTNKGFPFFFTTIPASPLGIEYNLKSENRLIRMAPESVNSCKQITSLPLKDQLIFKISQTVDISGRDSKLLKILREQSK